MRFGNDQNLLTTGRSAALPALLRALVAVLALLLAAQGVAHAASVTLEHKSGVQARKCAKAGAGQAGGDASSLPSVSHNCGACLVREVGLAVESPDTGAVARPAPGAFVAAPTKGVSRGLSDWRAAHGARAPPSLS